LKDLDHVLLLEGIRHEFKTLLDMSVHMPSQRYEILKLFKVLIVIIVLLSPCGLLLVNLVE